MIATSTTFDSNDHTLAAGSGFEYINIFYELTIYVDNSTPMTFISYHCPPTHKVKNPFESDIFKTIKQKHFQRYYQNKSINTTFHRQGMKGFI